MVIRSGVTRLKKTRVAYLLDLFEGRGAREGVVKFSVCGASLHD